MSVGEGWCVSFIHHSVVTNFMHLQSTYAPDLQNLQSDGHLESSQTSAVKLFCMNSQRVRNVGYFCRRVPSCIFDRIIDMILNATLPNNLLQLEESLRKSFLPLELHKGILASPCFLILLIYTNNNEKSSTMQLDKTNTCD